MLRQIELRPEMDANHLFAVPVSHHLTRQAIAEARDKDGNHLWPRIHDQLPYSRLRTQKRIRIRVFVARSFRMKADDVAWSSPRETAKNAKRVLIKRALLRQRVIATSEKRRIHRPPTHDQVDQQSERRLIEKPATQDRKSVV